jgi:cell division protein FtsZ
VLELSEDEGLTELPPVAPTPEPEAPAAYEPPAAAAPAPASYEEDTLDLSDEAEDADYPPAAPFELSGMQAGDDYGDEYDDDVDDIVDPLAGLRGADEAGPYGEPAAAAPAPAADNEGTLDLGDSYSTYEDEPVQDDLLANADRLAAQDRPVEAKLGGGRRRSLLGGGSDDSGGGSGAGSTLFERMANLSRSSSRDDEDDDDGDDGPALSIPRFLGRQNNQ